MMLYDAMATVADTPMPHHRHLSKKKALELAPSLNADSLVGGILYWDAQVDDASHTMNIARTAAHHGAAVASSTRAIGFEMDGDRVTGVEVRDLESGDVFVIHAKQVINTAGVWVDKIQDMAGLDNDDIRASKGIHLVDPERQDQGRNRHDPADGKERAVRHPVGKALDHRHNDTDWDLDLAHPAASQSGHRLSP